MGSFNVSGGMSHISIDSGSDIVFIPLTTNQYGSENGRITIEPSTMIVSNSGAVELFKPRFLPIRGQYDDYGSVENIVRDANVEHIEDYFGISIEQFFDQISRNWCGDDDIKCKTPELTKELTQLSGMFELASVYDGMVKEIKDVTSMSVVGELTMTALLQLGFVHSPKDSTGDERYKHMLRHPDVPNVEFHSDKTWTHLLNTKTNVNDVVYSLGKLNSTLTEWKMPNIDLSQFDTLTEMRWKIEQDSAEFNKHGKMTSAEAHSTIDIFQNRDDELTTEEEILYSKCFEVMMSNMTNSDLSRKYGRLINFLTPETHEALENIMFFQHQMWATNNVFMPNLSGSQCGEPIVTMALAKLCVVALEPIVEERLTWD